MEKIGFIVDGIGDFHSFKMKFGGMHKVLKTDGPRGHCVCINEIVSKSKKQISILRGFKCTKIIVVIDFECRKLDYTNFAKDLNKEKERQNLGEDVHFVIANTMIENWLLADIEWLSKKKKFLRDNLKQKKYEGTHGKDEIKTLMQPHTSYSEVEHCPQLFILIRDNIAKRNSLSYKSLMDLLPADL